MIIFSGSSKLIDFFNNVFGGFFVSYDLVSCLVEVFVVISNMSLYLIRVFYFISFFVLCVFFLVIVSLQQSFPDIPEVVGFYSSFFCKHFNFVFCLVSNVFCDFNFEFMLGFFVVCYGGCYIGLWLVGLSGHALP